MPTRLWKPLLLIAFTVPLCILLWSIAASLDDGDVLSGLRAVWGAPWGMATLIDLFIGLGLAAGWIAAVEPRRWLAALLIVLIFLLGNVTTLLYLIGRTIAARTPRDVLRSEPSRAS